MQRALSLLIIIGLLVLGTGCAVISRQHRAAAVQDLSFPQLREDVGRYQGRIVILGGHIIEVRNQADQTTLVILQSPLGFGQEPLPPERSQGRFMLRHPGFLDPEVYSKGRTLTAAGRIVGQTRESIGQEPYVYPLLEALEIHLWQPREERYPYHPYPPYHPFYRSPFYDPWYDRHPWRGYPYRYPYG